MIGSVPIASHTVFTTKPLIQKLKMDLLSLGAEGTIKEIAIKPRDIFIDFEA